MAVIFNAEGCTPGQLAGLQSEAKKEFDSMTHSMRGAIGGDEQAQFEAYLRMFAHAVKFVNHTGAEIFESAMDMDDGPER